MNGFLALADGTVFRGTSVGAEGCFVGEAVFTTAMSGYQEVVTDPSFQGQLVAFSAPMVGNYGVADERSEDDRIHAGAVVMREARGPAWTDWLASQGVPALSGIDTRSLVLHLRVKGSMPAAVATGDVSVEKTVAALQAEDPPDEESLVRQVSCKDPWVFNHSGAARVAVLDLGCKRSLLRRLAAAGAAVTVLPHDMGADELAAHDGVVLSNGPGDPAALPQEIRVVEELLGRLPVLGVCLGHQLLALATGGRTFKLRFGHRGSNHPVLERASGRVLVTSQNHGFAVAPSEGREATHVSLYDGTVEGLAFPELRARSLQFHPEAGPGPHDAVPLLVSWVAELCAAA